VATTEIQAVQTHLEARHEYQLKTQPDLAEQSKSLQAQNLQIHRQDWTLSYSQAIGHQKGKQPLYGFQYEACGHSALLHFQKQAKMHIQHRAGSLRIDDSGYLVWQPEFSTRMCQSKCFHTMPPFQCKMHCELHPNSNLTAADRTDSSSSRDFRCHKNERMTGIYPGLVPVARCATHPQGRVSLPCAYRKCMARFEAHGAPTACEISTSHGR